MDVVPAAGRRRDLLCRRRDVVDAGLDAWVADEAARTVLRQLCGVLQRPGLGKLSGRGIKTQWFRRRNQRTVGQGHLQDCNKYMNL